MSDDSPHNENQGQDNPEFRSSGGIPKKKGGEEFPLQEYRLVPVDEWEARGMQEDEIDLIELVQTFWNKRVKIAKITGSFVVLGLFIALFSPDEFTAEATLMPEVHSTQSRAGSLLQQYGGLFGISGSASLGEEGAIPPQLYPNIGKSLPYQIELMNTPVFFAGYDTTATVHNFFTNIYTPSLIGYIGKFTIGLPGEIIGLFKTNEQDLRPLPDNVDRDSILSLSKEQMETVKTLRERLAISVDQETGVLTLTVEFPDPQAAAEIGQAGIQLLKESVKEYRTEKARQNLEFIQEQVEEAKKRFDEAQNRLAEFRDSNVNLVTAKAKTREQELQSQYDLTFNLYNSLSQRLEQAKLELQEETPVLTVLQPVSVPLEDNTSGLLILLICAMLGGIISLGWVLIESWWHSQRERLK